MINDRRFPADMNADQLRAELARTKFVDLSDEPCGIQDQMADYRHDLRTELAKRGVAAASEDHRYAYVGCVTCGKRIQLIDFYGSPHRITCAKPVIDTATLPPGVNLR